MNKKAIVSTFVALALVMTGTAYAYWTDSLNVTTKATTGELDVTFVDLGLYAQYDNELDPKEGGWSIIDGIGANYFVSDKFFTRGTSDYNAIAKAGTIDQYTNDTNGYHTVTFDAELVNATAIKATVGPYNSSNANGSDDILIEVNAIYPGYAQAFRSDIINVGTIAAKLSNVKVAVPDSSNATIKEALGVAFLVDREYFPGATPQEGEKVFQLANAAKAAGAAVFTVGGVDFVRLVDLEKPAVQDALAGAITNANLILGAGSTGQGRMDIYLGIAMDPDADGNYTTGSTAVMANNDDADSELEAATISIDLLWDQFNAGNDADTSNWLSHQN